MIFVIIAVSAAAAAALLLLAPTYILKAQNMLRRKSSDKIIYLTFDDGCDVRYTPQLLSLLDGYGIKAGFFTVAESAAAHPEIIRRELESGHTVGLHSCTHKSALLMTPAELYRDFGHGIEILEKLGIRAHLFRPPWGHFHPLTLFAARRFGLSPVLWDVMAQDWLGNTTAEEIAQKLLRRTGAGDIVCLHDGRGENGAPGRTIEALRRVIPVWLSEGYRFEAV